MLRTLPAGFHYLAGFFDEGQQAALLGDVRSVLAESPLSVRMANAGEFGWVTDREGGCRYQRAHPVTGRPWPGIPQRFDIKSGDLIWFGGPSRLIINVTLRRVNCAG